MKKGNVLEGKISSHLVRLAIPSIGGSLAFTIFNLTDTYFVSKLGTDSLAAMGYTFPIVMIVGAIASGISRGASSILARAVGENNKYKMQRIATDGIILAVLFALILSIVGYATMTPLFSALGAKGNVLKEVISFMSIWYIFAFVVVIPGVSDSSMRAIGDMKRPLLVMLTCAITNIILDPIFIFGYFGVPAMGIRGAALATAISRFFGMILTLSFVTFHYKLINFRYNSLEELITSWKNIIKIGIPNILTRLIPQLIRGAMIKLASLTAVSASAVAALAIGQKVESFATIGSMAVAMAITPIFGQNYGAKKFKRVIEGENILTKFAFAYGFILFILVFPFGRSIISIFSVDETVIVYTVNYLKIIALGTIGLNLYNWISEVFTSIGKPKYALFINLLGGIGLIIPTLYIGFKFYGFIGMLIGLSTGQFIVGIGSVILAKRKLLSNSELNSIN